MEFNPPPTNPPQLFPAQCNSSVMILGISIPQPRIELTSNTSPLYPPPVTLQAQHPLPFNPTRMTPVSWNNLALHQPSFNPLSGFIHQAVNVVPMHELQMQLQPLNPPNPNHPSFIEFTFVMEYMGERIAVQKNRLTRFQILYLYNVASYALHNKYSPPNHIFRLMVAPRWLGRVVRVQNDALLRGIVQQCISRGECGLHIWVNFIPDGHLHHPPRRVVSAGSAEVPVIVDIGDLPRSHAPQALPPLVSNVVDPQQPQPQGTFGSNSVDPHHPQPQPPSMCNSVEVQVAQSVSLIPGQSFGVPLNTPKPSLPIALPHHSGSSHVHTVGPVNANAVTPTIPTD